MASKTCANCLRSNSNSLCSTSVNEIVYLFLIFDWQILNTSIINEIKTFIMNHSQVLFDIVDTEQC